MIRELNSGDDRVLMEYLRGDSITNYFIILSLEMSQEREMFERKWGEFDDGGRLKGVLLKRKTGNMQFYSGGEYEAEGFCNILRREEFIKLIAEESVGKELERCFDFSRVEESSYISRLDNDMNILSMDGNEVFKPVETQHIDKIIELYRLCFKSFAPKQSMIDKYLNKTGRGYFAERDGRILCVVQSAYEDVDSAIIVGVATHPEYRNMGLATFGLRMLLCELLGEGKKIYLQYENLRAGDIYKKLGFIDVGRMRHYYKSI